MALTGSLADLGVLDLIQFPSTAGKTGELIVAGMESEARLYYSQGQLLHAASDASTGMAAIIELISFSEGEFEFRVDVAAPGNTVDIPIEEIIEKVKTAQEQAAADVQDGSASAAVPGKSDDVLNATISTAAQKHSFIEHVALFQSDGELICKWDRDQPDEQFETSIHQVINLLKKHPREGLNRIYFSDSYGTIVATLIAPNILMMINAESQSSLGMVSLASTKLTQTIQEVI